ncbi:hypothetical protein [Flavobacterium psychrotrophum]|uniref:hypothetical protein n=1 Tax=Flavobacterium psychrotrophum TaxID=2294119 RepID=UPI000E31FB4C|nr:hypothetical protein [Flavobacterium psychrotrophum]
MKFLKKLLCWFFPKKERKIDVSIRELDVSIRNFIAVTDKVSLATRQIADRMIAISPQIKKMQRARKAGRLKSMARHSRLSYKSIHKLAEHYGIPVADLVDYYFYFGRLPDKDYAIIIKHFGVKTIISNSIHKLANLPLKH